MARLTMILAVDDLGILGLPSGRVIVRRVGRFAVGQVLLTLRLFRDVPPFGDVFLQKNRVGIDVERLNGRGRCRVHHAGCSRGAGSLLQKIDQMKIRDTFAAGIFLASLRPFRSRVRLLATLTGLVRLFAARTNIFGPFIGSLLVLAVRLVGKSDESSWIQGIRADSVRFQRNLRGRR
ncbi:hypothetical protein WN48_08508 [Eufriesea mexicana]|uniref:Uncharacterized protein n=1 Tax=Eufriesea mexicana TaxID=516756 RepID=A0A310SJC5_9HYME|nr:hypothetical protein WN48_08508 [Eufriesea mexicana]